MDSDSSKLFQCSVMTPSGTILDCRTPSVEIPAHDGQIGVLVDRLPLFCQLGLGLMHVSPSNGSRKTTLLIDGGFALLGANTLKIIADTVITQDQAHGDALETIREGLEKELADARQLDQRQHLERKLHLLEAFAAQA